jgi:hypothetical protein
MSNYVVEVPNFKYNQTALLEYQSSITAWKSNVHYSKIGVNTNSTNNWFDYYPDSNEDVIKDITQSLNIKLDASPYKFTKHLTGGVLPWHIDPHRECVFMIPLTDNNEGLQWVDNNNNIIAKHVYTCPTVINAKIRHGCPRITKDRIFLQVNIPCSWEYLKNNYTSIFLQE